MGDNVDNDDVESKNRRKEYLASYYLKNKDKIAMRKKELRELSKDEINAAARERQVIDPAYREARLKTHKKSVLKGRAKYESDPEYRRLVDERKIAQKIKFDNEYYKKLNKKSYAKHSAERNENERLRYKNDPVFREKRLEYYRNYNKKRLLQKKEQLERNEMLDRLAFVKRERHGAGNMILFNSLDVRFILGLSNYDFYVLVNNQGIKADKTNNRYLVSEGVLMDYINKYQ